jgi:pyrroloquinoline quinone (PQQ) biosynthesis protein C
LVLPQGNRAEGQGDFLAPPLATTEFQHAMRTLSEQHRPSRMPFFRRLASLPREVAADPYFLGQIHLNYQSAMHATRAAVYHLPYLDSPALRRRKLRLLANDGGRPDDTDHHRLTRAFRNLGAALVLDDEEFGEPEEMCCFLDGETAHFVRLTQTLYARSLGPWCTIEVMSGDWMTALAEAFAAHFPAFADEAYFTVGNSHGAAAGRAAEALAVTETVLQARPELLPATLRDARIMAEALDGVWTHLDRIAHDAAALAAPRRAQP